jgi:methionyl aminopeptidase
MALVKTELEIEKIRNSSLLVGKTIAEVAKWLKPGITTGKLDQIAETYIHDHKAQPAFKGYHGFPATLCISINQVVVHGIPGNLEIKDGDLVSIDCGTIIDGYYGDSAFSFGVGEISPEVRQLLEVTKESLYKGISVAISGKRVGDIGYEVQSHVESFGYSVVRDLVGHGLGTHLHEKPEIPNYGKRGNGMKLEEGMVICIEPMINAGTHRIVQERDGWTIRTYDNKPSAHFEHAIVVRKEKAELLSSFEPIEHVENTNITIIR